MTEMIYHIATEQAWQQAQSDGQYEAASLQTEGFIHASTAAQVTRVAETFYASAQGLVLLYIDTQKLVSPLRWEEPAHPKSTPHAPFGAQERFPHIYGPIGLPAISRVCALTRDAEGQWVFPHDLF